MNRNSIAIKKHIWIDNDDEKKESAICTYVFEPILTQHPGFIRMEFFFCFLINSLSCFIFHQIK